MLIAITPSPNPVRRHGN